MSSRSLRVVSLAAAAASATVWLAACGSAGTTPAATTTPTNPTTSTSSPATAPTQTQSPQTQPPATSTPAVTTTPGLAACSGSSLRITVDASLANGAAGSVYYPLNFVNTSAATCQMYGYPGVSFVTSGDATGQQIGAAALRAGAFPKVSVRLAQGRRGAELPVRHLRSGDRPLAAGLPAWVDRGRLRRLHVQRVLPDRRAAADRAARPARQGSRERHSLRNYGYAVRITRPPDRVNHGSHAWDVASMSVLSHQGVPHSDKNHILLTNSDERQQTTRGIAMPRSLSPAGRPSSTEV
jgi:hypothetical protein